jgi:energy-coupling factor transporter ATP-binding protein EcfA2
MMAAIIEARDLVKRFDGFTAVDHISFAVPEGVIFAFLGPNGAGKTTTIKMLTTVLTPSEGRLLITGHDPVTEPLLGGNALLRALRALARIERTLFTLQWLSDPVLRQRSHAGLNKGEASNTLRRAVFFHSPGGTPGSHLRESELPRVGPEPHHGRHCALEHGLSRPGRPAVACPGWDSPRRSSGSRRPARMGAHWTDRGLRLDRARPQRTVSPATRGSCYVPGAGGLACSFEQIVRRPRDGEGRGMSDIKKAAGGARRSPR